MKVQLLGSGQTVELLTKGVTERKGHWHRYGSQLKWVNTHQLTYHEGMGRMPSPSSRPAQESPHQGTLFDLQHYQQQARKKSVRLVVPRPSGDSLHQLGLFSQHEEPQHEPVHYPTAEEKEEPQEEPQRHVTRHEVNGAIGEKRILLASNHPLESNGIDLSRKDGTISGKRYEHLVSEREAASILDAVAREGGTWAHGHSIVRSAIGNALTRYNIEREHQRLTTQQPKMSNEEIVRQAVNEMIAARKQETAEPVAKISRQKPEPSSQEPAKALWQQTRAEAGVGEAPGFPEPPRSLKKLYGQQGPTEEQRQQHRQAIAARSKKIKEHEAYVGRSNAHLYAVMEALLEGKPVPEHVVQEYPGMRDRVERERNAREQRAQMSAEERKRADDSWKGPAESGAPKKKKDSDVDVAAAIRQRTEESDRALEERWAAVSKRRQEGTLPTDMDDVAKRVHAKAKEHGLGSEEAVAHAGAIAALEGQSRIGGAHLAEAVQYETAGRFPQAAPRAAESSSADDLPLPVQTALKNALTNLQHLHEARKTDVQYGGNGRYEWEAYRNHKERIDEAVRSIAHIRDLAQKNGKTAAVERAIAAIGIAPTTLSPKAAAYEEQPAQPHVDLAKPSESGTPGEAQPTPAAEQPQADRGHFIRDHEVDKLRLHFKKEHYNSLDAATKQEIRSNFLWSNNQRAWVSRAKLSTGGTWKAENIAKQLGLEDRGHEGERLSFAEQEKAKVERAQERAEGLTAAAQKRTDEAKSRYGAYARERQDHAFLTQPGRIPARERMFANDQKAHALTQEAQELRARALTAEETASQERLQDRGYLQRRIDEHEARLREHDRDLAQAKERGLHAWGQSVQERKAQTQEKLDYFRGHLDKLGGVQHSKQTVHPGDFVKIGKRWERVKSAGPKNIKVHGESYYSPMYSYAQILDHKTRDAFLSDVSPEVRAKYEAWEQEQQKTKVAKSFGAVAKFSRLVVKAHVSGHYRTEQSGKMVYVKDYETTYQKRPPTALELMGDGHEVDDVPAHDERRHLYYSHHGVIQPGQLVGAAKHGDIKHRGRFLYTDHPLPLADVAASKLGAGNERMMGVMALQHHDEQHGAEKPVVLLHTREDGYHRGVIIAKSAKKPGQWQKTYFDKMGFVSDTHHRTREEAAEEALSEGYRKLDPARLEALSQTDEFQEGVMRSLARRKADLGKSYGIGDCASLLGFLQALRKAHVSGHYRTTKTGKRVYVADYENRTQKGWQRSAGRYHADSTHHDTHYPGQYSIERSAHRLTADQRRVEEHAAGMVEHHANKLMEGYEQRFGAHKTIDADNVKQLFHEYEQDPVRHAASVHEPSSTMAKMLYQRWLDQQPEGGTVIFTAGGGGSGKSTAGSLLGPPHEPHFTYDATLSNFASAKKLIDAALKAKQKVRIRYVHRPADLAATGMIKRAAKPGNRRGIVPSEEIARAHFGAQQTLFKLNEHYRNDRRVRIRVIDNSGTPDQVREIPLAELRAKQYNSITDAKKLTERGFHAYRQERAANGEPIPDHIQKVAFADDGGRGQQSDRGRVRRPAHRTDDSQHPDAHAGPLKKSLPTLLLKAHVTGHYRRERSGKQTYVKDYDDSRQKQLALFQPSERQHTVLVGTPQVSMRFATGPVQRARAGARLVVPQKPTEESRMQQMGLFGGGSRENSATPTHKQMALAAYEEVQRNADKQHEALPASPTATRKEKPLPSLIPRRKKEYTDFVTSRLSAESAAREVFERAKAEGRVEYLAKPGFIAIRSTIPGHLRLSPFEEKQGYRIMNHDEYHAALQSASRQQEVKLTPSEPEPKKPITTARILELGNFATKNQITPPKPEPKSEPKPEHVVNIDPSLREVATQVQAGKRTLAPAERGKLRVTLGLDTMLDGGVPVRTASDARLVATYLERTGGKPETPRHTVVKEPPKPKLVVQKKEPTGAVIAAGIRARADAMSKHIAERSDPGILRQNPTARRARIGASILREAEREEDIQRTLYALADMHDDGSIPDYLRGIRTRGQVETLRYYRDYPKASVNKEHIEAMLSALKGQRGMGEIRATLELMMMRGTHGYHVDVTSEEADAVRKLAAKAKEQKVAPGYRDWAVKSLRGAKAVKDADIAPEHFQQAREHILRLGTPADKAERERKKHARELEHSLIGAKIPGFFPTPKTAIQRMLDEADIQPGEEVLEPSAGKGDIMDLVKEQHPDARLSGVEISGTLREILHAKGHNVVDDDFLKHDKQYDKIIMNPPFENFQDVSHIQHAYDLLKPGGKVVAIAGESSFFRGTKKASDFRDWLDTVGAHVERLPEKTFQGPEAFRQTGVNARMVVIRKPAATMSKGARNVSLVVYRRAA